MLPAALAVCAQVPPSHTHITDICVGDLSPYENRSSGYRVRQPVARMAAVRGFVPVRQPVSRQIHLQALSGLSWFSFSPPHFCGCRSRSQLRYRTSPHGRSPRKPRCTVPKGYRPHGQDLSQSRLAPALYRDGLDRHTHDQGVSASPFFQRIGRHRIECWDYSPGIQKDYSNKPPSNHASRSTGTWLYRYPCTRRVMSPPP